MTTGNDGTAGQADARSVADDNHASAEELLVGALHRRPTWTGWCIRIRRIPATVLSRRTHRNGLTPEQEEERLRRWLQEEALAEAEYQQQMTEIRESADRLMEQLDERTGNSPQAG